MKTTFKIIKQESYDRYVFVHYDDDKQICGLNFHQGVSDGPLKEWYESNDRIMKEYRSLCEERISEPTEKYMINTTLERYWKMIRLEEDGPGVKIVINNIVDQAIEQIFIDCHTKCYTVSGDISPMQTVLLDGIINNLKALIYEQVTQNL
jgi:hypothetical protein